MSETLRIGAQIFHKTDGVFRVPLADLSSVRFTQVPYYSTLEVSDLPGSQDTYTMSVSATHAGGSHNENFSRSASTSTLTCRGVVTIRNVSVRATAVSAT